MTNRVLACAVALLASFEAAAQVVTVPALPKKGYIGMSYGVAGGLIPETDSTAARAVTYPVVSGVEECPPIALERPAPRTCSARHSLLVVDDRMPAFLNPKPPVVAMDGMRGPAVLGVVAEVATHDQAAVAKHHSGPTLVGRNSNTSEMRKSPTQTEPSGHCATPTGRTKPRSPGAVHTSVSTTSKESSPWTVAGIGLAWKSTNPMPTTADLAGIATALSTVPLS